MKIKCVFGFLILLLFTPVGGKSQDTLMVDQIVAVVGTKMIKLSTIEAQLEEMRVQGQTITPQTSCQVLEQLLISNLYALQADEDSIFISDAEIDNELERRIRYFSEQIGSREKLEEFYKKSIMEIKEEFRDMVKMMLISGRMEGKITEEVTVTPTEVKRYFNALDEDSIPLISTEFELGIIVKKPIISKAEMLVAKNKIEDLRNRIEKGERFAALAAFYSEDPGSAKKGGELGYTGRGFWMSEFESMAFSLKPGELSPVFETAFGYHILEVIDRKGESVNVRHILIRPKANIEDIARAKMELDSVSSMIDKGQITFTEAVKMFSDEAGRQADGIYLSPYTNKSRYASQDLEPTVYFSVEKLAEGSVSNAMPFQDESNNPAYRLFYVIKKVPPHKANLIDDYDKIYNMAFAQAKKDKMASWMKSKIARTYIRIMDSKYSDCDLMYSWKL